MNTNQSPNAIRTAAATRKTTRNRTVAGVLLAGGLALAGLGLASGTAQAAPTPAPQGNLCFDTYGVLNWCSDY
jgi:hypothetical protein